MVNPKNLLILLIALQISAQTLNSTQMDEYGCSGSITNCQYLNLMAECYNAIPSVNETSNSSLNRWPANLRQAGTFITDSEYSAQSSKFVVNYRNSSRQPVYDYF